MDSLPSFYFNLISLSGGIYGRNNKKLCKRKRI